jgi:tetratricopeptide (TPR) repeat protein
MERAALAALRADQEDPWAHLALSCAHAYRGRIADALASCESALRLNPNFSLAQGFYGLVLSWIGRSREGAEAARRAMRLSPRDPLSAIYYGIAAYAAFAERDYAEAVELARKGIRQRGDFAGGWRVLTAAAAMAGDIALARDTLRDLRRVQPNISLAWVASELQLPQGEREHFLEGMRRAGLE